MCRYVEPLARVYQRLSCLVVPIMLEGKTFPPDLTGSKAYLYRNRNIIETQNTRHTREHKTENQSEESAGSTARVNKTVNRVLAREVHTMYCRMFEACTDKCIAKFIFIIQIVEEDAIRVYQKDSYYTVIFPLVG